MADFTLQEGATISNSTSGTMKLTAESIVIDAHSIVIDGDLNLEGESGITITGGDDITVSKNGNDYTISSSSSNITILEGTYGATTVTLNDNVYTITSTDTNTNTWGGSTQLEFDKNSDDSSRWPYGSSGNNNSYAGGDRRASYPIIFTCYSQEWSAAGDTITTGGGSRDGNFYGAFNFTSQRGDDYPYFEFKIKDDAERAYSQEDKRYSFGRIYCQDVAKASDERLKYDITDIENAVEIIMQVSIKTFKWSEKSNTTEIGVTAQQLLSTNNTLLKSFIIGNEKDMYGVTYDKLFSLSTKALQETIIDLNNYKKIQENIIETQNTKIQEIENELKAEKEKTAKLEADISAIKSHLGI